MPNQRAEGVTPRTVAMPDSLWSRVGAAAAKLKTTPSAIVRQAITDYLDRNAR